jgi:hypothetical protein
MMRFISCCVMCEYSELPAQVRAQFAGVHVLDRAIAKGERDNGLGFLRYLHWRFAG